MWKCLFSTSHLKVERGIEFQVDSHFLADRAVIDQCLREPRIPGKKCDAYWFQILCTCPSLPLEILAIVFTPEVKFHNDMS